MTETKVKIIEPSKEIFEVAEDYINLIQKILPSSKITLIGSFAIPMCGKEEIDFLVETDNVLESQKKIEKESGGIFGRGPIINGEGFSRSKKRFGIICELHFAPKGHKKINEYLKLIKNLRANSQIVKKYETLKKSLEGETEDIYKKKKSKFLEENNLI